jgi:type I restriction enzyme M protein
VKLYGDFEQNGVSEVQRDGQTEKRVCAKIFDNREFGFLKITVERPLRLDFQASEDRLARLWEQSAFQNLATTMKRKDTKSQDLEIEAGRIQQSQILHALGKLDSDRVYISRTEFEKALDRVLKNGGLKLKPPVWNNSIGFVK